jgi:hypothetical protein
MDIYLFIEISLDGTGNFVHILLDIVNFLSDILGKVGIHVGALLDFALNIVGGIPELAHSFAEPPGYSRDFIRTKHHHHYK